LLDAALLKYLFPSSRLSKKIVYQRRRNLVKMWWQRRQFDCDEGVSKEEAKWH
jgi:hypothetical protein